MSEENSVAADSAGEVRKTWLEVALNGPWGRKKQPRIPITVKEIVDEAIACVNAGAAIVHLHAYDAATGRQDDRWETYAEIITGVRSKVDAIVYPTIPSAGFNNSNAIAPEQQFGHTAELAKRGLIEWAVVDPGSVNITHWDQLQKDQHGFVYANPEANIRYALDLARKHRFHPAYAIYEPGFLRLGAGLAWRCSSPSPVYRFMFSTDYSFGFPPEDFGLTAYLNLIDRLAPGAQWMIGGLGVNILHMIPRAVMEGGHVRVGLEDVTFGTDRSNLELVTEAVEKLTNCGATLASASDVRATLAVVE